MSRLLVNNFDVFETNETVLVVFNQDRIVEEESIEWLAVETKNILCEIVGKTLILDFRKVIFFSTSMTRELLRLRSEAKSRRIPLILSGMNPLLKEMFRVTRLDSIFPMVERPEQVTRRKSKRGATREIA